MSNPKYVRLLAVAGAALSASTSTALAEPTTLGGANYAALCQSRGVPLPPQWGGGRWSFNGPPLPGANTPGGTNPAFRTLIVPGQVAHVYYAVKPEGLCMALPRTFPNTRRVPRHSFGVICQGNNGKVCYWDNTGEVANIDTDTPWIASTTPAQLGNFIGGADLWANGANPGGQCTDCHAGRNTFIVMPTHPTNLRPLGVNQDGNAWFDPIVHSAWSQNPGPGTTLDNVATSGGNCLACHSGVAPSPNNGGRLPPVSLALPGYCYSVAQNAQLAGVMPPPAFAGDYSTHWNAFFQACATTAQTRPPMMPTPRIATSAALISSLSLLLH